MSAPVTFAVSMVVAIVARTAKTTWRCVRELRPTDRLKRSDKAGLGRDRGMAWEGTGRQVNDAKVRGGKQRGTFCLARRPCGAP